MFSPFRPRSPFRTRRKKPRSAAWRLTARPPAPRYWRNIGPALRALPDPGREDRARLWLLVLEARRIPCRLYTKGPSIFVPPVRERIALREIAEFEAEKPPSPLPRLEAPKSIYGYAALVGLLIPWHWLRWAKPGLLGKLLPDGSSWLSLAGLDAWRTITGGEWWRSVTALTMHSDAAHLLSNVVTGSVFGIALCRHTGVGLGILLTLLAGCAGNLATAWIRPASYVSQGFSTAVFASVGLLCALAASRAVRHALSGPRHRGRLAEVLRRGGLHALPPLGAGLALLAMLGGSQAPRVDYLAHCLGLLAGILLGLAVGLGFPRLLALEGKARTILQGCCLVVSAVMVLGAWSLALG